MFGMGQEVGQVASNIYFQIVYRRMENSMHSGTR